jgi:3-oxoacyl-[acyl-carrier protein] reductase
MQLGLYGCYVIAAHSGAGSGDLSAVDELKSLGTLAESFESDLTSSRGAAELVDGVSELYGRLDILVNCLSFAEKEPFESLTDRQFAEAVDAVIRPAVFGTREALRLFKDRPKPRVVNVLTYGTNAGDGVGFLAAAVNSAVESLTRSLAASLPANYRINAVAVKGTGKSGGQGEDLDPELFRPKSGVDPDDVARTVVFLLSSEAKGLNGQVLEIG